MPIIIWGTRGITSTVEDGEFHCPRCDERNEYKLKQVRPFFTLFFLPIFPIGGAQRYVECGQCGTPFEADVLNYEPPTEAQRMLGRVYEELKTGTSLEVGRHKLVNAGMDADEADKALAAMCEGEPARCLCGKRFHPSVRQCSECGADL